MRFPLVIVALIGTSSPSVGAGDEAETIRVFIFAGQSNMAAADSLIAGTGAKNLADAGQQTEADRRALFTYGPVFRDDPACGYEPWGEINGHRGGSFGKATDDEGRPYYVHGPEVGFARALDAAGVDNIAIIKVAANIPYNPPAGDLWPWSKGAKGNSPDFYGEWNRFLRDRLEELAARGYKSEVAGFAWHQGIDDGINRETADTYAARLKQLIADLRADYDCPRAPFIIARSCKSPIASPEAMAPIREAQVRVAESAPLAGWIDVDDLELVNSHHFTAEAQLTIGERMGKAWLERAAKTD